MAGGSQVIINKNGITFITPSKFEAKAGQHKFLGGTKSNVILPSLPKIIEQPYSAAITFLNDTKQPMVNYNYRLIAENGTEVSGVTDQFGKTQPIETNQREKVDLLIADLPNDEQKSSGKSPLLKESYEELFYTEDPEDQFDDIDLEIEE